MAQQLHHSPQNSAQRTTNEDAQLAAQYFLLSALAPFLTAGPNKFAGPNLSKTKKIMGSVFASGETMIDVFFVSTLRSLCLPSSTDYTRHHLYDPIVISPIFKHANDSIPLDKPQISSVQSSTYFLLKSCHAEFLCDFPVSGD